MTKLALKEWACVIEALIAGHQKILLRKGGILDAGGDFKMEADEFLLYPTYEHQKKEMIRPEYHALFDETIMRRSAQVEIRAEARVTKVEQIRDISLLHPRKEDYIWSAAYLEMRSRYKPEKPLFVVTLETRLLPTSIKFHESPEQSGCVSWVKI